MAVSTDISTQAFLAAERGLAEAVGGRYRHEYGRVAEDAIYEVSETEYSGGVETRYTLRFRSIDSNVFFVESTGEVLGGGRFAGATHRAGMFVRPVEGDFTVRSAIETVGSARITGHGYVSGHDHIPEGWEDRCGPLQESVPAVISSGLSYTHGSGTADGTDPPIVQDTTIDLDTFLVFGGLTFDELAAHADFTLRPGVYDPQPSYNEDGTCDVTDPNNWGEASGPCANHFPVIYIRGPGRMQLHGFGQGILLVDGDFAVRGGGRYTGIVITRGQLSSPGWGNGGVTGGLIIYNNGDSDEEYTIAGNGVALYSRCAVNAATRYANALNDVVPIVSRGWVDVSGSGAAIY
jgi:hypothetical protein